MIDARAVWICLLPFALVACIEARPPIPSVVGPEHFQVSRRGGNDLSSEEYGSFYLELMDSLGAARDDLIVEIGVGDLGTTITATSVDGVAGTTTMSALLPIAFPDVQFNEVALFGRRVFRPADPNTISRHIAVFADPTSAFIIDAPTGEALARATAAFP